MRLAVVIAVACASLLQRGAAAACADPLFLRPVQYATAADQVILVSDLDGDAAPEILTSGNQTIQLDAFSILPNRGDGTFGAERLVSGGHGDRVQDIADLDGDGITDLLASSYWGNGIVVYRGIGEQRFDAGAFRPTATHGGPTLAIDYDRDGRTDVVSFSFGSRNPVRVHLFQGLADGTLSPKTTVELPLGVADSPSARVHEGRVEILVGDRSGYLGILRFTAEGVTTSIMEAGPGTDWANVFADVNGDGVADVVDTTDGGGESELIFVTLAKPDGGFLERKQLAQPRRLSFPVHLQAADFDGDGHLDLIAGDFRAATLYLYRGTGSGEFDAGVPIEAGGPVNDLAVADINGDRYLDVAAALEDQGVSVMLNRGRCGMPRRRAVRH